MTRRAFSLGASSQMLFLREPPLKAVVPVPDSFAPTHLPTESSENWLWTGKAVGASVGGLAVEPNQVAQPQEVPVLRSCELERGALAALFSDSSGLFNSLQRTCSTLTYN